MPSAARQSSLAEGAQPIDGRWAVDPPDRPGLLVLRSIQLALATTDGAPVPTHEQARRVQRGQPLARVTELAESRLDRADLRVRVERGHDGGQEARVQLDVLVEQQDELASSRADGAVVGGCVAEVRIQQVDAHVGPLSGPGLQHRWTVVPRRVVVDDDLEVGEVLADQRGKTSRQPACAVEGHQRDSQARHGWLRGGVWRPGGTRLPSAALGGTRTVRPHAIRGYFVMRNTSRDRSPGAVFCVVS